MIHCARVLLLALSTIQSHFTSFLVVVGKSNGGRRSERYGMRKNKKKIKLPFYRLSMIDDYNNNMNNVDIADQLRTVYRYDRWMWKQKWWWSIAFWALQMLQTNAYIIYCKYHKMHLSEPMSHYDFIESIALSWLDEEHYGPKKKRKGRTNLQHKPPSRRRLYDSSSSSVTTRSTTSSTEDNSTSTK